MIFVHWLKLVLGAFSLGYACLTVSFFIDLHVALLNSVYVYNYLPSTLYNTCLPDTVRKQSLQIKTDLKRRNGWLSISEISGLQKPYKPMRKTIGFLK